MSDFPHRDIKQGYELEEGLWCVEVEIAKLREQDLNAQVMQPREFERLTENIRERGTLEQLPYCTSLEGGPIEIISGHHRFRAARAAGKKTLWLLYDSQPMTRSTLRARQIAHNALVGSSNDEVLRQMLKEVRDANDLLTTGLPADYLPTPETDASLVIGTPHADFDWRVVSFAFLPHQLETLRGVIEAMSGPQDLVGAAPVDLFDEFAQELAKFARFREVRSVGTAIFLLTKIAKGIVAQIEERDDAEEWVSIEAVLGTDAVPAPVARVIDQAIRKRVTEGKGSAEHRWHHLEAWAAEELAT